MYQFLNDLIGNEYIAAILGAAAPILFILTFALFAVLAERKVSAFMQDRIGPNRVGPHGLFQTVADILKLLQKEDIMAAATDKKLFNIAPVLIFIGCYSTFAAIPFSSAYIGSGIDLGLFYILAISSIVVVAIIMAGWASNNKYSLLGAIRSAAQIISYEIPTALVILTMAMLLGTLNLKTITELQTAYFWNWNLFGGVSLGLSKFLLIPFMIIGFIILFISTLAETNRVPFDIPEAESELVSGFHTEYSGMKFAMFFLSEYGNMFAVSAVISAIFLGGYQSPFGYLGNTLGIPWLVPWEQFFWFTAKGLTFVFIQMWVRWTLPRLRVDQLMNLCWKYLIPYAFVNLIVVGFITLI
jgi:NADH-quinone oxidoreductase subunit H